MNIFFKQTRDIYEYGKITPDLLPDFGNSFCHTILSWCDVIPRYKFYWEWYMIYDGNKPIGCCGLYSLNENTDELWLGWFGLIPEYRNKNIGIKALGFLYEIAKTIDCKVIYSYVDKEGKPLNFYKRNGFEIISSVKEFLLANNMESIDGEYFEDMDDYVIKKIL